MAGALRLKRFNASDKPAMQMHASSRLKASIAERTQQGALDGQAHAFG
jgi:hypothetical protein